MIFIPEKSIIHMGKKSIAWIVIKKSLALLIFLALLWVASYARIFISNSFYNEIVQFLMDNLELSVIIYFFSLFSAVFWNLEFPGNMPAPIFSAFSSYFVIKYLYNVWLLIDNYVEIGISFPIQTLYYIAFAIVLIVGYIIIISKAGKIISGKEKIKVKEVPVEEEKLKPVKERVKWGEIRNEFKSALYGLGRSINSLFSKKREKPMIKEKVKQIKKKKKRR